MQKSTLYAITVMIICFTVILVTGEYFLYKYASLLKQQSPQVVISVTPTPTINALPSGSSENSIISFNFKNPIAVGSINQQSHTIAITLPPDTDVTKLMPVIEISNNTTISPSQSSVQDFTNPVTYTVTAQNGSTQKYIVTVNVASVLKAVEKLITSFNLSGFSPRVEGAINNNAYTIYVVVPDGTDLTKLTPTIEVSDGATVSPKSQSVQDFTNPVTYTVTDIYGTTQDYTITVVTESNSG